jgi:DNA-binding NtrC family response regulator
MLAMSKATRVLLVDDEALYVESLAKVLRRRGVDAETALDGPAALAHLQGAEFDVIVLDLRMPGMDGIATLAAIRQRDSLTPVLLLSGQADVARATSALKNGAVDFLTKPCPVETLVAAIEDAAERKAALIALARAERADEP